MLLSTVLVVFAFAACLAGTFAFTRWSRRKEFLDVPNERSSHSKPVPVGAGLIISSTVLAALSVAYLSRTFEGLPVISLNLASVFLIAAVCLVAISWRDDIKKVPVFLRFLTHSAAAALVLWFSSGWIEGLGDYWLPGIILSFIWIVGLTNAYNFMDGIDGISGVQALTAGIGWGALGIVLGLDSIATAGFVVGSASLAFLVFNWEPARVFMGDSGSAFLGFTFACLPILAVERLNIVGSADDSVSWVFGLFGAVLAGPFVVDSSLTFLKRLLKGERVWEAHRSHMYQAMVIGGSRHATVALIYAVAGVLCSATVIASVLNPSLLFLPAVGLLSVAIGLAFFAYSRNGKIVSSATESE
ncbi:MAG: UDP-phosphate N-acetylglucosaminyl 1-phosphate transferase [Acidobacteria bacterium]|nr:MAG: UDP-phosphate N-acetylglucosaminyl 1-phosphate transferase [Acidobacteriota bacterium]REK01442.1 MAG: UDP-phosphate N-acetylglucosaminyl 1-phosphate transferase [Acidobacteriota bacterium]REK14398.1 MAG: UDP-phosphate N-acetylglucosaminyl 1-phosphate transferase [Acidobacteriota bacterium]REK45113.1 MAG: UDP-phosphate N-acetylglucosaminyl 1-phosphate transferase [Acidobacteriota bacterium]